MAWRMLAANFFSASVAVPALSAATACCAASWMPCFVLWCRRASSAYTLYCAYCV